MAGGSYSYNRFNNFDKLVEGAKPDFLDMDKDGNKKETFKKAVKDKEKGCKDCGKEDCGCDDKKEVKEAMSPGPRKDKMAAKQHNPYTSTRDRANAFNISTRGDGPGTPGYEKKSTGGKGARYAGYGDQGAGTNNLSFAVIKFTKATTWNNDLTQNQGLVDAGFIRIVGTGAEASDQGIQIDYGPSGRLTQESDYRLKTNISDYQDASQVIKNLKPRTYNWSDSGKADFGFIAHELQEFVPKAVVGTKDATEAIGTVYDFDGTVLETEVTEPPAEELTYTEDVTDSEGVTTQAIRTRTWTATGTRPVYQGVDQIKLIPLLTKALQEALSEIDTLKDRLDILEAN